MYQTIKTIAKLCDLLADEKSKDVFWARVQYDADPSEQNARELNAQFDGHTAAWDRASEEKLNDLLDFARAHERLLIYGTQEKGRELARILTARRIDFTGFCGRRARQYPDGLMGKPVIAPEELFARPEETYVIVAAGTAYAEILSVLRAHQFPSSQVYAHPFLMGFFAPRGPGRPQYFEFPAFFRQGSAFVDGGCYDLSSSVQFSRLMVRGGGYSCIFAFEPDEISYERCLSNLRTAGLHDVQMIPAGLSNEDGTASFNSQGQGHSRFSHLAVLPDHLIDRTIRQDLSPRQTVRQIRSVRLDSVVGDTRVGMIKMDIEGAEYAALHGARNTIVRDRPFLAICVYHVPGDILAIMRYLNEIVPEYRYLVRQYSYDYILRPTETVLYAFIP